MLRLFASILLVLALPACGITPPSSVFASLSPDDQTEKPRTATSQPQPEQQQAGIGSSIGNLWDTVKSGIGLDSTEKKTLPAGPVMSFEPAMAQKLINDYRAQKGLKPLKVDARLNDAAHEHSADLAKSDRISHYGSDGSDAWDRVQHTGYPARLAAENVGTGQLSINEVFKGWQESRSHNANLLLSDAEEMGISMVYKPDTQYKTFWTLVLASRN